MSDDAPTVHEPVPGVRLWTEGERMRLLAGSAEGGAVSLDAVDASLLADLLRTMSEPGFPDPPYENPTGGYAALMHVACVERGCCGCLKKGQPLHVDLLIPPDGPVTADQFAEWVLLADDMNPNDARWNATKAAIRAAFVRHMGAEVVDARRLRWEADDEDDAPPGRVEIGGERKPPKPADY